jgi:uncharacterized NAD-dependent epimerase/dehydratase family protein
MSDPRYLIIADGDFGPMTSKTANSVVRYHPERTVAVLDREHAGRTVQDVLGFGGAIPVVSSMREGLALGPSAVLIGIAPKGGQLPSEWRAWLGEALDAGCDIWNGLHTFLSNDPALAAKAAAKGARLLDLRRPPADLPIASGLAKEVDPLVVLTVGTDCNVGKMTAQLQLTKKLNDRGIRTRFVPTGQTGIMIEGWGIAVDAVVADFIAGAAERLVVEGRERGGELLWVEGQGSLIHPVYSGVTLGLYHGSAPHLLVLCHEAGRTAILGAGGGPHPIPPLRELVDLHERMALPARPARVVAVALNTHDLDEDEARTAIAAAEEATGLPADDPVRFGAAKLVDAVLAARP